MMPWHKIKGHVCPSRVAVPSHGQERLATKKGHEDTFIAVTSEDVFKSKLM
jgi:hypothetical protein